MDIKILRKLSRKDLLELLIEQVKENEELKRELEKTQKDLDRIKVINNNAGSLAEASLALVDIFEKADQAAEIYLENLKNIREDKDSSD